MDVAIRCRPPDPALLSAAGVTKSSSSSTSSKGAGASYAAPKNPGRDAFSSVSLRSLSEAQHQACATTAFDHRASQMEVASLVVEPHLERLIHEPGSGFVCIAYGQTGSGKTHSIFGPPGMLTDDAAATGTIPDAWGVFPRSLAMLLNELQSGSIHAQMRITAVEVYLERVYDLLNDRAVLAVAGISSKATSSRIDVDVTYDANGKWKPPTHWKESMDREAAKDRGETTATRNINKNSITNNNNNAKEMTVSSMQDIALVARTIEATRSAKAHSLNERSSRSHCLITVSLYQIRRDCVVTSNLVFADLAGSERVKDSGVHLDGGGNAKAYNLTNNIRMDIGGTRLDEAKAVNTSLSALGRVVAAMSRNDKFISFRDSALTQLLKPALTSQAACRITVLLALRSEPQYAGESASTQRFGAVCANAAKCGGKRSTGAARSSSAKTGGGSGSSSSSRGSIPGIRVSTALAEAVVQLTNAEQDILKMQAEGLDEHPVRPCTEFPLPTIQSFMENKRQFDESALEVRKWKQKVLELRAQVKFSTAGQKSEEKDEGRGSSVSSVLKHALEKQAAAEHLVFVYSGLFYRQASTGIWIPRHKRLVARMNDRERLRMQVDFLRASSSSSRK
jgi:hypothetical protein